MVIKIALFDRIGAVLRICAATVGALRLANKCGVKLRFDFFMNSAYA